MFYYPLLTNAVFFAVMYLAVSPGDDMPCHTMTSYKEQASALGAQWIDIYSLTLKLKMLRTCVNYRNVQFGSLRINFHRKITKTDLFQHSHYHRPIWSLSTLFYLQLSTLQPAPPSHCLHWLTHSLPHLKLAIQGSKFGHACRNWSNLDLCMYLLIDFSQTGLL